MAPRENDGELPHIRTTVTVSPVSSSPAAASVSSLRRSLLPRSNRTRRLVAVAAASRAGGLVETAMVLEGVQMADSFAGGRRTALREAATRLCSRMQSKGRLAWRLLLIPGPKQRRRGRRAGAHQATPMSHYVSQEGQNQRSEVWELFFQFDGAKFVQNTMYRAEIRYLNLLSIMESEGYGMSDSLYHVKHEGEGLNGLALVDSNLKVEEMVRKYELSKKLVLTVMRDKRVQSIVLSPVKKRPSVQVDLDTEDELPLTYQMGTQASICFEHEDTHIDEHIPLDFLTQDTHK